MQVPSKDLRWAVGCILAEGDQTPDDSLLKTLQGQGYKTIKLPEVDRVTMTLQRLQQTLIRRLVVLGQDAAHRPAQVLARHLHVVIKRDTIKLDRPTHKCT